MTCMDYLQVMTPGFLLVDVQVKYQLLVFDFFRHFVPFASLTVFLMESTLDFLLRTVPEPPLLLPPDLFDTFVLCFLLDLRDLP